MKNITIALPENYVQNIQYLVDTEYMPSRSETIRQAIYRFLAKEAHVCRILRYTPCT
jgi:Arc/MetJ-type ribon-helix-helix transcriptional regulator